MAALSTTLASYKIFELLAGRVEGGGHLVRRLDNSQVATNEPKVLGAVAPDARENVLQSSAKQGMPVLRRISLSIVPEEMELDASVVGAVVAPEFW